MKCTVKQSDRITGDRFKKSCCDLEFFPGQRLPKHNPSLARRPVVFCKTDYVLHFFNECSKNLEMSYILVTHNSDINISSDLYRMAPPNVTEWFAQNINYRASNLHSIPIGSTGSTWIGELEWVEQQNEHDFVLMNEDGHAPVYQNLLYMNFGIHTSPHHRQEIYDFLKNEKWVTTDACDVALHDYERSPHFVSIKEYYHKTYNHKFTISPLGNGLDCGRVWQAIYLGCIPIVPRHINIEEHKDLPILIYDNLADLTEKYLQNKYKELSLKQDYNKATLSYWKSRIQKASSLNHCGP